MISVIHQCFICKKEVLGKSNTTPTDWGVMMNDSMMCDDCVRQWRERFNEEPPVYEIGGVKDDPFKENDNDNK